MRKNIYLKFIGKCLLCLIPLFGLVFFTAFCPMCYMDEEYPAWRYSKEVTKADTGEQYYNTVILGDSIAKSSIIPTEFTDESCVNLAVGGATAFDMYYSFKTYLENHEAPENAVILFGPFHYWHIDNYKTRSVYFKSLKIADAAELYENARKVDAGSVIFDDYKVYELSCRLSLPTVYLPALNASGFTGRKKINKALYESICDRGGYSAFGTEDYCDDVSYEASYDGIDYDADVYLLFNYLKSLLEECEAKGCRIFVVQPALNEATFEVMDENYLEEYKGLLDLVDENFENVCVEKSLRCYGNEYFGDASHLNERGAKKYTQELKKYYGF